MRKRLLLETADCRVRKAITLITYLAFIAWLMYSQNKISEPPPKATITTVSIP